VGQQKVPQDIKVNRNSLPGTTCQARNKTTTIMSKARAPKRKVQEYVPPDEVKIFAVKSSKLGCASHEQRGIS
jgi:hypothetical protein